MAWIWTGFLVISLICAAGSGQAAALTAAVLRGAELGVTLSLSLAGSLCLWSGLNTVMTQIGLSEKLSHLLSPLLGRLFPAAWQDRESREALCTNVSANLLGLGSAATPPGVLAVKRMAQGDRATDELCRLVVLNTASIQLLPATVAAVRAGAGAAAPFDILPAVWITSVCSVAAGLLAAKVLSKWL